MTLNGATAADARYLCGIWAFCYASDATGVVLRVHYKSMKCDVLFSQGSVRTIFRWGGHCFIHEWKKLFPFTTV